MTDPQRLIDLDRQHLWHPFTPMRQWAQADPVIIDRAERVYLIDTLGRRYIDGVSSLWCNVHGHRVPAIDAAIRRQLDKVAHSTLLGLGQEQSILLAAELVHRAPRNAAAASSTNPQPQAPSLTRVFYSDAGSTALEVAFKMAVGYWYHSGQPAKNRFIGFREAYHGDTAGAMSVGYSDLFHRPFRAMAFPTWWAPTPDALRLATLGNGSRDQGTKGPREGAPSHASTFPPSGRPPSAFSPSETFASRPSGGPPSAIPGTPWPSEDPLLADALRGHCLAELEELLAAHADETAAVVIEPIVQGAAGMICQPPGFLRGVAELARKYGVLLIADEVAVGFGRTGRMFACEHEGVAPDLMCVAKGITGGYLPLAATLATEEIFQAFCGEPSERKTLYHGHTYTGNALACAAALASLELFDSTNLLGHINESARLIARRLDVLRDEQKFPHVIDVRQRGLMIGIELGTQRVGSGPPELRRQPVSDECPGRPGPTNFDFSQPTGAALCQAMRPKGLVIRPLGDVLVLMPIPAMPHDVLGRMLDIVVETLEESGKSGPV